MPAVLAISHPNGQTITGQMGEEFRTANAYFAVLLRRNDFVCAETKLWTLIPIHTTTAVIEMVEVFSGHCNAKDESIIFEGASIF